jgi:hypothetical protein
MEKSLKFEFLILELQVGFVITDEFLSHIDILSRFYV